MTLTELRGLVGRLSYKPGWTMRAGEDFYYGPMVEIRAEVPDSYSPDRMISIRAFARLLPLEYLTEDLALTAIGHAEELLAISQDGVSRRLFAMMTANDLLAAAALCVRCKAVHPERIVPAHPVRGDLTTTTAAPDGHPYSPILGPKTIERLRELMPVYRGTGLTYEELVALGLSEPSAATWVADQGTAGDVAALPGSMPEAVTEPPAGPVKPAAAKPAARSRKKPAAAAATRSGGA